MNPRGFREVVILCITLFLFLIPIAGATYDVVSNISSNSTEYTSSSSYGELHNISLATGAGTTFLTASWDAGMSFSAPLYARFLRDGVSFGRFNMTQNVYATVGSYQISFAETAGTHYYGWQVYSNKKGFIYSRNFSAFFLVNGSYGSNVSSVTAESPLTYTGTTDVIIKDERTTYPNSTVAGNLANWNATYNATYDTKPTLAVVNASALLGGTAQVTGLDTALAGKLAIATYSGDFPNSTLINYLLTSTYSGNFPNSTVAGNLANWNATYNSTYAGTTSTVDGNLASWNATYNSSYASGGFDVLFTNGSNVLAAGTKAHVKAKYAGTLTDLTAHSVETGSINISAYNLTLGTYIGSVVITAGTDGSTSGLSYVFAKGDWLNLTVSSVTDIKQVTAAVQTTKS